MSHALATPLAIPTPKPRGTHRSPLGRLGPSPRPSGRLAAVSTAAAPPVALPLPAPLLSPIEREAADSCSTIFFSGGGAGEEEARPPSSRPGNTARPSCHRRPALRRRGGPRESSSSSRLPPFSIPSCNILQRSRRRSASRSTTPARRWISRSWMARGGSTTHQPPTSSSSLRPRLDSPFFRFCLPFFPTALPPSWSFLHSAEESSILSCVIDRSGRFFRNSSVRIDLMAAWSAMWCVGVYLPCWR